MTRRTVLVTGATRGIGRELAALLADDWRVLVGGRDAGRVTEVVAALPDAAGFVCDLADERATADAAAGVGPLDALVHSAGVVAYGASEQQPRAEWRRILELNVIAVSHLTALLLPGLRAASGQVVVVNSGSGFVASPHSGVYAASKFAVRAWADALREEERGRVRVTSIHPGRVDTDMQHELLAAEHRPYEPGKLLTARSVAESVRYALDAAPDACVESLSIRPSRAL